MDRKRLIAGAVVFVLLMILCISGSSLLLNRWNSRPGRLGHRAPLPGLAYCSSRQSRPCILSFNLNPEGGMLIHLLVNGSLQDFYLKIRQAGSEHIYECTKARRYSSNATCTGESMPVGKDLSFLILSEEEDATLAEGTFPIIGLALATPEVYFTPTPISVFDHSPR